MFLRLLVPLEKGRTINKSARKWAQSYEK